MTHVTFVLLSVFISWNWIEAKVFEACELGLILLERGIDYERLGDWICLAHATSRYDSSMIAGVDTNPYNNFQYGIFQISNYYYCYDIHKPTNNDCGLNCTELVNDDLGDDIRCARLIYLRGGNSFRHWTQFASACNSSNGNLNYYASCDFANGFKPEIDGNHKTNVTLQLTSLTPGQIIVKCQATGTLPIQIGWTKNRKPYSNEDPDFSVETRVDPSTNQSISAVILRHVNFTLSQYVTLLTCEATNKYGRDSADFLVKLIDPLDPLDSNPNKAMDLALTLAVATVIILMLAAAVLRFVLPEKNGLTSTEIDTFLNGDDSEKILISADYINETLISKPYNNDFEISKHYLKVEKRDLLGSGQFGLVYKGVYREKTVAVKTLKPDADKVYLKALLSELKVLIYLKGHANITEVIGAYTKELRRGQLQVLLEFCPLGSLDKFLQDYRKGRDSGPEVQVTCEVGSVVKIDTQSMIGWSYQIASAMEYLTSKKVVHGDLATRNVLLKSPEIIKITDFGLSQKLYNYSTYVKGDDVGPLPWRWLAPETLQDLKFSASSDVWSFGITLWEIFSYAQTPYPGLSWSSDFLRKLEGGLRLTRPSAATEHIFQIMENCWKYNPKDRPNFTFLRQNMYLEVNKFCAVDYIDLNLPPVLVHESLPASSTYRTVAFVS